MLKNEIRPDGDLQEVESTFQPPSSGLKADAVTSCEVLRISCAEIRIANTIGANFLGKEVFTGISEKTGRFLRLRQLFKHCPA